MHQRYLEWIMESFIISYRAFIRDVLPFSSESKTRLFAYSKSIFFMKIQKHQLKTCFISFKPEVDKLNSALIVAQHNHSISRFMPGFQFSLCFIPVLLGICLNTEQKVPSSLNMSQRMTTHQ